MRKFRSKKLYILFTFLIVFLVWVYIGNNTIDISRYDILDKKIPKSFNGFKIVHISDFHNENWGDKLVSKIKNEKPDIIVITGDFVDSRKTNFNVSLDFIRSIRNIAPIYYVSGNHESRIDNINNFFINLKNLDVNIMDNSNTIIKKGNDNIMLIGIKDPAFYSINFNDNAARYIDSILKNNINKSKLYKISLCHRPEHIKVYAENKINLAFAGHAHGGQVRLPFLGGLLAPHQGLLPKYTSGVYKEKDTNMVVSRGLGHSVIRFRVNNNPELVIVTLKNK